MGSQNLAKRRQRRGRIKKIKEIKRRNLLKATLASKNARKSNSGIKLKARPGFNGKKSTFRVRYGPNSIVSKVNLRELLKRVGGNNCPYKCGGKETLECVGPTTILGLHETWKFKCTNCKEEMNWETTDKFVLPQSKNSKKKKKKT